MEKITGLTEEEAIRRKREGKYNFLVTPPSKTKEQIIKENIFTYFNFVFLILAILLIMVGSFRDLTFLPVIIINALIGIFQELKAKKILDEIQMINVPTATVIRDGKEYQISIIYNIFSKSLHSPLTMNAGFLSVQDCIIAQSLFSISKINSCRYAENFDLTVGHVEKQTGRIGHGLTVVISQESLALIGIFVPVCLYHIIF